jgi:hypothetical protein
MKKTNYRIFLIAAVMITALCISAATFPNKPSKSVEVVQSQLHLSNIASTTYSSCMAVLLETAKQAEIQGSIGNTSDGIDGGIGHQCMVQFINLNDELLGYYVTLGLSETAKTPASSCKYDPISDWQLTKLEGYNARTNTVENSTSDSDDQIVTSENKTLQWCMHKGGRNYHLFVETWSNPVEIMGPAEDPVRIAKIMTAVAEKYLPLTDETYEITEVATEEIVTEEVTEEATQEVVVVPYGGETEEPTAEVVMVPYGGESQEETTAEGGFEETWDSEQAKAIRSPYLPILGGLFGGGAAWLLSQGAANASSYASTVTNYVKTLPQTAAPEIPQAPPELVTELPELVTTPPKLETEPPKIEKTESPEAKKDEPVSAGKLALNLVKDAVNATGNIDGVYFKYLAGKDSQEVVEAIRKAVKLWHEAPSAESAAAYMEALKSSNALKDSKLGGKLSILSKGIDLLEAAIDTANISQERGYDGWETAATAYAKVGEKALVWWLTKHPVAALADAAMGGATQMAFGEKYKVDIGTAVDKAHQAWDTITKSASQKACDLYYGSEANKVKAETLQNLTERIRKQVEEGTITKNEGAYRLERVLEKMNRETPKL